MAVGITTRPGAVHLLNQGGQIKMAISIHGHVAILKPTETASN